MKTINNLSTPLAKRFLQIYSVIFLLLLSVFSVAQDDDAMLNQFIQSQGMHSITFDASNVKQFWVSNSVFKRQNNAFEILLEERNANGFRSDSFPVQLANISEKQDCRIVVMTETEDMHFSVFDNKSKEISDSNQENDFLKYHVFSATIHIEDIVDSNRFSLVFSSSITPHLYIKSVNFVFIKNSKSSFLESPGVLKVSGDNVAVSSWDRQSKIVSSNEDGSFGITGKTSSIITKNNIYVSDKPMSLSLKVKNTGDFPTRIYAGFIPYSFNYCLLDNKNYPRAGKNTILKVLSVDPQNGKVIVDGYAEWNKGNYIAFNAKEDLSDIPSTNLLKIVQIDKLENGNAEITLDAPLQTTIKENDKLRIHGSAGQYKYAEIKELQPGEESFFNAEIKRDDNILIWDSPSFSRGVYYTKVVILSYSIDSEKENSIVISDFTVAY